MGKKSKEEAILYRLHKEISMMICMLIPLVLHQCNCISPFHFGFVFLSVDFILDIFWNAGEKCVQHAPKKKRKTQKPGKSISNWFARKKDSLNLNGTCTEIRGYGKDTLLVYAKEIAKGSNGTVIFEGAYEGREVAVKRLFKALNNVALKEVQHLIASDEHPNIVRLHGVKVDKDHVYLVLERCFCSLSDFVSLFADSHQNLDEFGHRAIGVPLNTTKQDIHLWKSNGYPSALLLKLMRDMVKGLDHLHKLGIIHQDIKPQNVMIAKGVDICAKLSDIGICLPSDKSSLSRNATGCCSPGWVRPEQKLHKRQRWAADMFSLGCVFHFCLSRGGHPFDHQLEHEIDNGNNKTSLHLVGHIPEAVDLLSHLLDPNPKRRPKAYQVLRHPLFWDSETRLSFLRDVSDRLQQESRKRGSRILIALERVAQQAFGARWDRKMESELVNDIFRCRDYRNRSVQHLLRVVRNKLNHYYESPKKIKELLGTVPEGLDEYFSCRFPRLLMEVYKVVIRHCRSEKSFEKYFGVDSVPIV